jgi:hypothetical protein
MTGRPRTTQELIHWLGTGAGAQLVLLGALFIGGLALAMVISWRQFHGAASEATLVQADLGRQLASGAGFTTRVNYPQAAAYLRERGVRFDPAVPYPEVYQAPLYPIVIAAGLKLLPSGFKTSLFSKVPAPPYGFGADYYLLVLNLLLFALALWLVFDLGRRLFGPPGGWLAAIAVFVSIPIWQQVVAVNGTSLMMVLVLAAFSAWWRIESAEEGSTCAVSLGALGALCGALFLTEYSSGMLIVVAAFGVGLRFAGAARLRSLGILLGAFLLVTSPWVIRNLMVTGLPTGLALQNLALKAGDTTAEPAVVRATMSASLPRLDLNKLANKVLTTLQDTVKTRAWSGGAMWFTAFFAAGWLYVFKSSPVNRIRWLFVLSLVVLVGSQATFNSGDSERQAVTWLAPLVIVFGSGFFFVLLSSNPFLASWPRLCAAALLAFQAVPLAHDALDPHWLHFQYPPYFPQLFQGMRHQLNASDPGGRFGLMADVPGGLAWYGGSRVWAQPATLRDFYAVQVEQPTGELLLTPRTLDRPFFSDLNAKAKAPSFLTASIPTIGEWGEVYGGILTGNFPREFPLGIPRKITDDLYVLFNSSMSPGH